MIKTILLIGLAIIFITSMSACAGSNIINDAAKKGAVELYITSWCPYCKKAIEYFESRGIKYKAYDIEKDNTQFLNTSAC